MAFNHYAKIKRILEAAEPGWYVRRIDELTSSKTFKGETRYFDHYYRVYDVDNQPIAYCKFQQIDRFASAMKSDPGDIVIRADETLY